MKAIRDRAIAKLVATRKDACEACDIIFYDNTALQAHLATPKHKRIIAGIEKVLKRPKNNTTQLAHVAAKTYHCHFCNYIFRDSAALKKHKQTPRHKAKATATGATE